jgi:HAD superfamily hydrolase (TIGR01509 family)
MSAMYKGVLFDLDGTILEPGINFKALRERLSIPQGESILDWVLAQPDGKREAMDQTLVEVEVEAARQAKLMPGAEETMGWLLESGVRVGILTRNCWRAWEIARDRCGLNQLTDVFTRESAPAKPNPACLTPITEHWGGIPAQRIIHVGDYLYDLQLAANTGMYSVLLHSSGMNPFPVHCDHVAADHQSLLAHLRSLLTA